MKFSKIIYLCLLSFYFSPITLSSFELSNFKEIKNQNKSSDAIILDRNNKVIHEIRVNKDYRMLSWIELDEISPTLIKTLLIVEDKRFYEHSGVDWIAVSSSLADLLTFSKKRGASTITMQLASLLNPKLRGGVEGRTIGQKIKQMSLAKEIEEKWTKKEILEAYLNLVSFRGELIGIHAASKGFFEKLPHGLSEMESVILVSMIRSPASKISRVQSRSCYVYKKIHVDANCKEIKNYVYEKLSKPYFIKKEQTLAPFVANKLLLQNKESKQIYQSTLDYDVQSFAIESLKQQILSLKDKNVNDAAVVVIENKTGEIFAYIGNSMEFSDSIHVDAASAKRQTGSTLKPFIYALAFEKNVLTPDSTIEDSPIDINVGTGIYKPSNYQEKFYGKVTVKQALGSSLNIPAIKALELVEINSFREKLADLNISDLREAEFYGLSIALGSLDTSLLELTNAYRMFANHGLHSSPRFSMDKKENSSKRIFSEKTTEMISDILSNRENRQLTFGLESPLSTRFWSAVKTGTSKDMRDNWCIGYTERFTVGVWVGNFSGKPMWNVTGVTGAAPLWSSIINYMHKKFPHNRPKDTITKDPSIEKNKQVNKIVKSLQNSTKIKYPIDGEIIGFDPGIPIQNQKVVFELKNYHPNYNWYLNQSRIQKAGEQYFWTPKVGLYQLEVRDGQNKVLDKVQFEVR